MNTPNVELLRMGRRIRAGRTGLSVTQRTFAASCGLHQAYLGEVERGERNVTFAILCVICVNLGCDIAALTNGIPALPPPTSRP